MKSTSEMKAIITRKFFYSDIELLEVFQSALLIFVNPFNLSSVECADCGTYLSYMSIPSFIIGIITIISVIFDYHIKSRIRVARLHWVLCVVITSLMLCSTDHIGTGLLSYYIVQCVFCAFIIIRLNSEFLHNKRTRG